MNEPLLRIELGGGLELALRAPSGARGAERGQEGGVDPAFPTDRIPKAPTLELIGADLAEEGVGFGLPVLRGPFDTIFPGSFSLYRSEEPQSFRLDFEMCLVERLAREGSGGGKGRVVDLVKESFAFIHRELPFTRRVLTLLSDFLRGVSGLRTVFVRTLSVGRVRVEYRIDSGSGRIAVRVDAGALASNERTRLILMNEAGARRFDLYEDSDGTLLRGREIESWRQVRADRAAFRDRLSGAYFAARARPGARLFSGRELVGRRLSWAGLAYVLPPGAARFEYEIEAGLGS